MRKEGGDSNDLIWPLEARSPEASPPSPGISLSLLELLLQGLDGGGSLGGHAAGWAWEEVMHERRHAGSLAQEAHWKRKMIRRDLSIMDRALQGVCDQ